MELGMSARALFLNRSLTIFAKKIRLLTYSGRVVMSIDRLWPNFSPSYLKVILSDFHQNWVSTSFWQNQNGFRPNLTLNGERVARTSLPMWPSCFSSNFMNRYIFKNIVKNSLFLDKIGREKRWYHRRARTNNRSRVPTKFWWILFQENQKMALVQFREANS